MGALQRNTGHDNLARAEGWKSIRKIRNFKRDIRLKSGK